jgi:hypothetical protein
VSYPWFRMYAEAVDDEKLRLLAFEDRWHFVALLCLKSLGTLDSDAPFLERRIALKLGLQLPQLDELKRRLNEIGLINDDWQPVAWERRQFKSDHDAAERKRIQREKERGRDSHNDVTTSGCDSHATEQNRTEQKQNRTERASAPPPGLDIPAWESWISYRTSIRRPLKQASIPAAQRKLAACGADQQAMVDQSIENGWTGLFQVKDRPKEQQQRRAIP